MAVKIIYEDKDILVCEKPAGLAVQSARISEPDMVSELKNYLTGKQPTGAPGKSAEISAFGGTRQPASTTTSVGVRKPQSVYLGVVHRLDQPVSGLLVFAKNKKAAGALSTQTAQHQMNKIYYAVVYTKEDLTGKRGTLTDWLVKEASIARVCDASQNGAKKAVLSWKCLACQGNRALLEVELETGRFHQIRVQMAHAGMPLLGDQRYGSEESREVSTQLGIRTIRLQAVKLALYEGSLFPDGRAEVFVFPDGQSGVPDSCRRAGGWKLGKSLRSEGVFADARARVRRKDADRYAGTGTPSRSFSQQFRYCHAVLPCSDFRFVAI